MSRKTEPKYSDVIQTDNRGPVRLSKLHPEAKIRVRGRTILAKDIPLTYYTLECAHVGQGIAVSLGEVTFCDTCGTLKTVVRARG